MPKRFVFSWRRGLFWSAKSIRSPVGGEFRVAPYDCQMRSHKLTARSSTGWRQSGQLVNLFASQSSQRDRAAVKLSADSRKLQSESSQHQQCIKVHARCNSAKVSKYATILSIFQNIFASGGDKKANFPKFVVRSFRAISGVFAHLLQYFLV